MAAKDGITGHLDEWHPTFGEGWKGVPIKAPGAEPDGAGWPIEQCSYWLDGLVRLGYVLHDDILIKKVKARLTPIVDGVNQAPGAQWQYALDMIAQRNGADITVERSPMPPAWNWPLDAPVKLSVPAQVIDWKPTDAQALPDGPVTGKEPRSIRLVPYGCTKFRISMFPVTARTWAPN